MASKTYHLEGEEAEIDINLLSESEKIIFINNGFEEIKIRFGSQEDYSLFGKTRLKLEIRIKEFKVIFINKSYLDILIY